MSDFLTARFRLAALAATFLVPASAFAQATDARGTGDLEKENAVLRAKIHRLEVENENVGLRAKLDQLRGSRPIQVSEQPLQSSQPQAGVAAPAPLVTRIQASSPGRSLVLADLPLKAAPVLPPIYSWTGFYIGGNVGYSIGSDSTNGTLAVPTNAVTDFSSTRVAPHGAIGGVQLGYNWQAAPRWAFGFEADFQGSDQKSTSCFFQCEVLNTPNNSTTVRLTTAHQLDYFGTVRGRVGYVDGGALFYVTGGGAYGRVNQSATVLASTFSPGGPPANNISTLSTGSTVQNKFGFAVGAGVEASLGGNWTGKVEYLYLDLGTISTSFNGALAATPVTLTADSKIHDNIIRAGLNYRFGAPVAPLSAYGAMAAVPPVSPIYSWTGFYIGVNAGYGIGQDHHQTDGDQLSGGTDNFLLGAPGGDITPKGFIGGAQVGYNWQASPHWLIGFETDLQGSIMKDTTCVSLICFNQIIQQSFVSDTVTLTQQMDWFSTARGRIGFIADNSLFYLTGGAAFAHVRQTVDVSSTGSSPALITSFSSGTDMIGYAVGGGIETMLWGGWSAKAEYLYMNLGDLRLVSPPLGTPPDTLTLTTNSTVHDHIVRFGANYHFTTGQY